MFYGQSAGWKGDAQLVVASWLPISRFLQGYRTLACFTNKQDRIEGNACLHHHFFLLVWVGGEQHNSKYWRAAPVERGSTTGESLRPPSTSWLVASSWTRPTDLAQQVSGSLTGLTGDVARGLALPSQLLLGHKQASLKDRAVISRPLHALRKVSSDRSAHGSS